MQKLAVLGAGNMGIALIEGLLKSDFIKAENIYATRNRLDRLSSLKDLGVNVSNDNRKAVQDSNFIIIAVKPHLVSSILNEIKQDLTEEHTLISIATGVSLDEISNIVGADVKTYRAMPNTASSVGEGMTCIATLDENSDNKQKVKIIFDQFGESIYIEEKMMDAATVIGACGIAYSLRFMRAMMQGAIEIGFDSRTASKIVSQMVKGSAEILIKSGNHPEEEIDKVTTPMGCTITGLNEMEHQGFSSSLIKGIVASHIKINK
ncbi:pyrroline-5-carboxylate reductase [Weeksellaceae bacterium KMM 9713]|uniref:Pyrroline-5-carboxylate reductase n=1 Tax=Profundicola chukchiensis TaxID=2961959 RepID=A0A9X4RW97_9FLAO|nr:pyrroline-5-carboxylate reductase [Profundicola chukchiensis]MDG4946770.1 pyrroline-5-carboxylate reductase [Profundicola chukchiensis]